MFQRFSWLSSIHFDLFYLSPNITDFFVLNSDSREGDKWTEIKISQKLNVTSTRQGRKSKEYIDYHNHCFV
ncbi:expressed protein [Echinococcus multilocularis]|uniref:Expressed protein n=1 Tax=Echinococcus multilocularis TaxID=6211 RepID=A0A087VX78_ECHMU|nr:expressed protein [Echinococcus multilocularis]